MANIIGMKFYNKFKLKIVKAFNKQAFTILIKFNLF
jgi:hypothetical protein